MQTDLLYMASIDACYDTSFQARVVAVKPDYVVLDRSLFYPLGGGQDWDTGFLRRIRLAEEDATAELVGEDGKVQVSAPDPDPPGERALPGPADTPDGLPVTEVTKRGPVKHVVGAAHGLTEGDVVHGEIDWERRYAHMRMHTAQHLVSGIAYELFGGARTVGNQLHADRSRIDFRPIDLTKKMMQDLEAAANDIIRAAKPVTAVTMTRDEVNARMPEARTNMDLLPKSVTDLRTIQIGDDIDLCPCAGTHVRNTKEIGAVQILGRKSKGSGTQRLEYTLSDLEQQE